MFFQKHERLTTSTLVAAAGLSCVVPFSDTEPLRAESWPLIEASWTCSSLMADGALDLVEPVMVEVFGDVNGEARDIVDLVYISGCPWE